MGPPQLWQRRVRDSGPTPHVAPKSRPDLFKERRLGYGSLSGSPRSRECPAQGRESSYSFLPCFSP